MQKKPLEGALFKAEKKSDRSPVMNGKIEVNGQTYEVAVFPKKSKAGNQYWRIIGDFPKQRQQGNFQNQTRNHQPYQQSGHQAPPPASEDDYYNDDIPF